jgi:hypothetical protein
VDSIGLKREDMMSALPVQYFFELIKRESILQTASIVLPLN